MIQCYRKLAQVGTELFNNDYDIAVKPHMDLESGFHIQVRYKLSRIKWINLGFMLHKHVLPPPYQLLAAHRIRICPLLFKYPIGANKDTVTGVYASLSEELILHFLRLLQFEGNFLESVKENCCLKVLGGLDCAGDQSEYQQRSQLNIDTSHVENGSYCLTSIHLDTISSTEPAPPNISTLEPETLPSDLTNLTNSSPSPLLGAVNPDQQILGLGEYDPQTIPASERKESIDRSWFGTWRDNVKVWSVPSKVLNDDDLENLEGFPAILHRTNNLDKVVEELEDEINHDPSFDGFIDVGMITEVVQTFDQETPANVPEQIEPAKVLPSIKKPLGYKKLGPAVYSEIYKGSVRASRPWFIIFMRENIETLRPLVKNIIEPQMLELITSKHEVNINATHSFLTKKHGCSHLDEKAMNSFNENQKAKFNSRKLNDQSYENLSKPLIIVAVGFGGGSFLVSFSVNFQLKSADGKLGQELTGRTGAHCFSCDLSVEQMHDPAIIRQGLSMNVVTTDLNRHFAALAADYEISESELDNFVIPSEKGDWDERLGLKGRPLSEKVEISRISSVLHCSVLRILTWINQLVPRWSTVQKWGHGNKYSDREHKRLKKAHDRWMLVLGEVAGYKNKPCPNQMTGYLASQLFEEKRRNLILDKISQVWMDLNSKPMEDNAREVFRSLFQRLSVIRRVISSDRCILITQFYEYCLDAYIFILQEFPWCLISDSLHRLLAHVWEHIVLNGNFGLASENEQRIECTHKER